MWEQERRWDSFSRQIGNVAELLPNNSALQRIALN